MKLEIGPLRSTYVEPSFGTGDENTVNPELERRLRRPMVVGGAVIGAFVIGLGLWAAVTPIDSGVTAPGELRVEQNRKTIRHLGGGVVKAILVKEGDRVRPGQALLLFDDVQPRAQVDVLQNQADSFQSQAVRMMAEATGRKSVEFPPELLSRMSDPRVAAMIRDQQFLFASRLQFYEGQLAVLNQRMEQALTHISGLQAQVDSIDEQVRLTQEELNGYQTLYEKGFAPKTLILRYQRGLADLAGRKGALIADISKTREQIGETRLQIVTLRDQRESQAADTARDMQSRLADTLPRLTAAQQQLNGATVRSPADGFVLNLSQFTVGGVAAPGEVLMDVVPANAPLMVTALIKPQDIDEVRPGMEAHVRLDAFNSRFVSPLPATVVTVSADRLTDQKTGQGYFKADLRIDPKELVKLGKGVRLTPGMPASTMIVTGKRTIMAFLVSPITDTLQDAFREQ